MDGKRTHKLKDGPPVILVERPHEGLVLIPNRRRNSLALLQEFLTASLVLQDFTQMLAEGLVVLLTIFLRCFHQMSEHRKELFCCLLLFLARLL